MYEQTMKEHAESKWQECYDKWNETLWDRLMVVKDKWDSWRDVVWHGCSYCRAFDCDHCPLHEKHGCHTLVGMDDYLTSEMHDAWFDDDKERFEIARKKFHQLLLDTKQTLVDRIVELGGIRQDDDDDEDDEDEEDDWS